MTTLFRTALLIGVFLQAPACASAVEKAEHSAATAVPAVPYGANAQAGGTFTHDGVSLYDETYGTGAPH